VLIGGHKATVAQPPLDSMVDRHAEDAVLN